MSAIDSRPFPKAALYGAAAMIGATLLLVGGVRVQRLLDPAPTPTLSEAHGPLMQSRSLAFRDGADGRVLVQDRQTGAALVLQPGSDGFVRGVLRALARERSLHELGESAGGFALASYADGSLWLTDEATGERIELGGFGRDNRAAFAFLLSETERT